MILWFFIFQSGGSGKLCGKYAFGETQSSHHPLVKSGFINLGILKTQQAYPPTSQFHLLQHVTINDEKAYYWCGDYFSCAALLKAPFAFVFCAAVSSKCGCVMLPSGVHFFICIIIGQSRVFCKFSKQEATILKVFFTELI